MFSDKQGYVIGVDGGGTETIAVLANLKGEILSRAKSGPASPRNLGIVLTAANVAGSIKKVLKKKQRVKILSTFIGLPAVAEEYKSKTGKIKKELLKDKEISQIFKGKVVIGSDQLVAFKSGTQEKEGMILIAGTGSVVHGWSKNKEVHVSGWGWLADEGSAFWIGEKAYRAIVRDLDGRGPKTLIGKIAFQRFKIKKEKDLQDRIYSPDFIKRVSSLAAVVDEASRKGDKVARDILQEAGQELALVAKTTIKHLAFQQRSFPLVLVGSVFKSKVVLTTFRRETKKYAPKVEFLQPRKKPILGAVRLALAALGG